MRALILGFMVMATPAFGAEWWEEGKNREQAERHHQELMTEMRKQRALIADQPRGPRVMYAVPPAQPSNDAEGLPLRLAAELCRTEPRLSPEQATVCVLRAMLLPSQVLQDAPDD